MRFTGLNSAFLRGESGAVSVDWVVFTAAVIGIGMITLNRVGPSASTFAQSVSDNYSTPRVSIAAVEEEEEEEDISLSVGTGITVGITY